MKIYKEKDVLKRKQIIKHIEWAYLNFPFWASDTKNEMNNAKEKIFKSRNIQSSIVKVYLDKETIWWTKNC